MNTTSLRVYRELADAYDRGGDASLRDRFLVLAAFEALTAGRADEAEALRRRLLHVNPHHLLRPYATMAQAVQTPDVQLYIDDLRNSYPPPVARQMLDTLPGGDEPAPAGRPLPVTATDLDLGTGLGLEPSGTTGLRMFSAPPEPDDAFPKPAAPPPPRPSAPVRPEPLPPPVARPPLPPPAPPPPARPVPQKPAPPVEPPKIAPENASPVSVWVSLALFVGVVGTGLALAGYTLARPFLP